MNELIIRKSPFNFVETEVIPYKGGASLLALRQALLPAEVNFAVSRNGCMIPDECLSSVFPGRGDVIIFTPQVGNGNVLRIVAMIVVVAIAAYVPGAVFGLKGLTALFASNLIVLGGTLLVNAILPPPTPRIPAVGLEQQSQTYSWQPTTTQQPGVPIPRHYGVNKLYGNIIAWHREVVGEKQYLNILLCMGIGPYQRLYDFEINDQPIGQYPGVRIDVRLGDLDQTPISAFNDTKIEYPLSMRISKRVATIAPGSTTRRIILSAGKGALFDAGDIITIGDGNGEATEVAGKASEIIGTDGINYRCIASHISSADNRPITGSIWSPYWEAGGVYGAAWEIGTAYQDYDTSNILIVNPPLPLSPPAGWFVSTAYNYYIHTTAGKDFDGLEVDIVFPGGIWQMDKSGSVIGYAVEVKVEIRPKGAAAWQSISQQAVDNTVSGTERWSAGRWIDDGQWGWAWQEFVQGTQNRNLHYEGELYTGALLPGEVVVANYTGPSASEVHWSWTRGAWVYGVTIQDSFLIGANKRGEVRKTFLARNLSHGVYEVRVSNLTAYNGSPLYGEDMYLGAVREVYYDDFQYPRHVLVGIRGLAQEKVSGSLRFSCMGECAKVRVWDGVSWTVEMSDNPAWVKYDILTRPVFDNNLNVIRYDGYDPAKIDLAKWLELAGFCSELKPKDESGGTEKRAVWNGGWDALSNVWAAVMQVSDLDRSIPIHNGLKLSLAIDKAQTPRQMFTVGNIERSSFKRTWLPTAERASSITATFVNQEKDYERDELSVLNTAIDSSNQINIQLFGETRPSGVWRNLRWRLAANQYFLESVEITVFVESLVSVIGDVIYLQYDVPLIGVGGRLAAATAASVTLDQEVTIAAGKFYQVMVSLTQPSIVVGTDGLQYMCRQSHVAAAANRPITGADWSLYWALTSEAGDAWANGTEYWQPGAVVLKNVTNAPGAHTTLNISVPWTKTPSKYDNYAFGEANQVTRKYRIMDMNPTMDFQCALSLAVYDENIYTIDDLTFVPPEINYVKIDTLPAVTELRLDEAMLLDESKATVRVITVSYRWPVGDSGRMIAKVKLYHRETGSDWKSAGETTGEEFRVEGVSPQKTYQFAVCSVNVLGVEAPIQNSPQASITTSGPLSVSVPLNISIANVGAEVGPAGALAAVVRISWENNPASELVTNYEIVYSQA